MAILTRNEMIEELFFDSNLFYKLEEQFLYTSSFNYNNLVKLNNEIDCLKNILSNQSLFNSRRRTKLNALIDSMKKCGLDISDNATREEVMEKLNEELISRTKKKNIFEASVAYAVFKNLITSEQIRDAHFPNDYIERAYHACAAVRFPALYKEDENGELLKLNETGNFEPVTYNPVPQLNRQHKIVEEKIYAKGIK